MKKIDVLKIKEAFPVFKKYPQMRYFDSAASAFKHQSVIDAIHAYLAYNGANVHRGVYGLAAEATNLYEEARQITADFIGAKNDNIVFTKSTTHSLNMVARGLEDLLQAGDEIIVSKLEHHSNLLPWLELAKRKALVVRFIELDQGMITIEAFKKVLNTKTKVVATHHMSNVMGYITPLKQMTQLAHEVGALVVVDAAQSILHIPTDVLDLDVDALAFSGHKAYGPNGIGVLYMKKDFMAKLSPAEFGGEMVDKVYLDGSTWKSGPYKFESGTPPIAEAIGLSKALTFLKDIGLDHIHAHELELRNYVVEQLKGEKGMTIFNGHGQTPLITFNIDDVHPHDTASFLDQHGVAVRAGHHCNQLTMDYLNQDATVRASIAIYNTKEDCDELIKAIKDTRDFFHSL